MPKKETSATISTIASRLLIQHPVTDEFTARLIEALAHANSPEEAQAAIRNELDEYVQDVRKVAASALGQDETRG
jgi:ABC-type nitrate/sulfonate/bicarbonate transport system substrate-binding protein